MLLLLRWERAFRPTHPPSHLPLPSLVPQVHYALAHGRTDVARCLLEQGQLPQAAADVLQALALARQLSLMPVVAARMALSPAEWRMIPAGCPNLSAALPAVIARSLAEAGLLMARLSHQQHARVRCAALTLARAQRVAGVELPPALVTQVLGSVLE